MGMIERVREALQVTVGPLLCPVTPRGVLEGVENLAHGDGFDEVRVKEVLVSIREPRGEPPAMEVIDLVFTASEARPRRNKTYGSSGTQFEDEELAPDS